MLKKFLLSTEIILFVVVHVAGGIIFRGEEIRTQKKACPGAILFTNPTKTDPDANQELRGEEPQIAA
jgi:hypothetical protein